MVKTLDDDATDTRPAPTIGVPARIGREDQANADASGGSSGGLGRSDAGPRGTETSASRPWAGTGRSRTAPRIADRVIGRGDDGSGNSGVPHGDDPTQGPSTIATPAFAAAGFGSGRGGSVSDGQQHFAPAQCSAQPQ